MLLHSLLKLAENTVKNSNFGPQVNLFGLFSSWIYHHQNASFREKKMKKIQVKEKF
jgi:hypothetical protein